MRRTKQVRLGVVTLSALTLSAVLAGCGTSTPSGTSSSAPIKVGLITENTGNQAGEHETQPQASLARIKWQNDHGGIDGRKIQVISLDDASSPTQNLTAAKALVADGVVAIIEAVNNDSGGDPYLTSQGVAVIEGSSQVITSTDRDVFGTSGELTAASPPPTVTTWGKFFKARGVTKLAAVGYGQFSTSVELVNGFANSAKAEGVKPVYIDTTAQLAQADWAPQCAAMKAAGVNGIALGIDASDSTAVVAACKQAGVSFKAALLAIGFGPSFLGNSPSNTAAQGLDFASYFTPPSIASPGASAMLEAFKAYGGIGYPGLQEEQGYIAADLLIYAMEHAGTHITTSSVLHALQNTTNYTAGGLEITPISFKSGAKEIPNMSPPPGNCDYFVELTGQTYTVLDKSPICGTAVGSP